MIFFEESAGRVIKEHLAVVMILVLLITSGCGTTYYVKKTERKPASNIKVTSSPSGARVEVNSEYIGETPCTFSTTLNEKTVHHPPSDASTITAICLLFFPFYLLSGCHEYGHDAKENEGFDYTIKVSKPRFETVTSTINSIKINSENWHCLLSGP